MKVNSKNTAGFYLTFLLILSHFTLTASCTWTTTASATSLGWNNPLSWTKTGACSGDWPFSSPLGSGDVINIDHSITITANITVPNNATLNINSGTFTVNGNVNLNNGSTFNSAEGTTMIVNGDFNNNNNSTGVTVDGSISVSGNLTSGSGSTVTSSSGTGSFTVEGSISGAGTVFGSTADCPDTGSPCLTSSANPLPIELLSISAECANVGVKINWSTASEYNNDYFQLARSSDGLNWENFYKLNGAGNSTTVIDYEITDQDRDISTRYYRLSQVDFDGASTTFNMLSVNCTNFDSNNELISSPNPSSNVLNLSFSNLNFSGDSRISIYSLSGKEVYHKNINVSSGNFVYQLNDLMVEPGVYYIKVTNGTASTNVLRQIIR